MIQFESADLQIFHVAFMNLFNKNIAEIHHFINVALNICKESLK